MKNILIRFFRGFSLRQRFLVAPLLGLVVCSVLAAVFIYESHRQSALLSGITERNSTAFNHYSEVFVKLTEQHITLDDLIYGAAKIDEATLYDQAKQHIYKVQQAVSELEQALPPKDKSASPEFTALRNELLASAQAYRNGVSAAVGMVTVNLALAPDQLARADERFTAMNRSFVKFLDLERREIGFEIAARVRRSQMSSTIIAFAGISIAALLFFLSLILSRVLSRSIETQIGILTDLGTQAGARFATGGSDEVERMTQAIAAFRQSLLELRESESRFRSLTELSSDFYWETDTGHRMLRMTHGSRYKPVVGGGGRGKTRWEAPSTHPDAAGWAAHRAILDAAAPFRDFELGRLDAEGVERHLSISGEPVFDESKAFKGYRGVGKDISEQKRAEIRIKRLNRVYAVLSGINSLIVRIRDKDELFEEACRIAVEHGRFKVASIWVADRETMQVRQVASAGATEGFLAALRPRSSLRDDAPEGQGPFAQAIKEKKAVVINDVEHDPRVLRKKECIERGISSIAILPLLVSDDAVGVLVLYADESGYFDEQEMALLTELAGDISFALDHIEKEKQLNYLAYYDALTGLANRSLFLERVAQYMRSAAAGGHKLAIGLIDLERFKNINDSLGRPAGDALLKQVAEWLTRAMGDASLVARMGADHFAVVLPEVKADGNLVRLIEKTMTAFLEHPFRLKDAEFRLAFKMGAALFPDDGVDADTLFKNAEAALKKAKAGGDRYLFYTQTMTETVAGKLTLENQLRQALDNEEFVLHYQPKANLASGKLTGAEALIRWNDPRTGLVPPGRFIPVLEETGLIFEVGRWALRKSIEDYLRWRAAGLPAVRIAVNVSPLQLRNRGFVAEIEQVIGIDASAPPGLELEITESLIMEDVKHNIASLKAIRAMGVTIAIDDFGTGFSSLSYLAKLPVDTLKIDRSFVIDMTAGPQGLALVSTIINLAHSLKLKVVAEGVETEEQSRLLRLLNCDEMQGFLFSKPVPGEILETRFLALPAAAAA
jgi:diguanylate cyclase (GGDEF)-like protein